MTAPAYKVIYLLSQLGKGALNLYSSQRDSMAAFFSFGLLLSGPSPSCDKDGYHQGSAYVQMLPAEVPKATLLGLAGHRPVAEPRLQSGE